MSYLLYLLPRYGIKHDMRDSSVWGYPRIARNCKKRVSILKQVKRGKGGGQKEEAEWETQQAVRANWWSVISPLDMTGSISRDKIFWLNKCERNTMVTQPSELSYLQDVQTRAVWLNTEQMPGNTTHC